MRLPEHIARDAVKFLRDGPPIDQVGITLEMVLALFSIAFLTRDFWEREEAKSENAQVSQGMDREK